MTPRQRDEGFRPAFRLLLLLSTCIFGVEFGLTMAFPYLSRILPLGTVDVADPVLLTALLFPILLLFVLRPMMQQMAAREKAQATLQTLSNELEMRVEKRTAILHAEVVARKKTEESLQLFRSLMDQSHDCIEIVDPATARILDVNEESCKRLGYTREEFLSLRVFDIDPLVDHSTYTKVVEGLRKSDSTSIEGIHRRKDGTTFPVEVTLKYVSLGRDYIVSIARDITERIRAEEERTRLAMAIEHAAEAVMITDTGGAISYVNPAFEQITGYTRTEIVGENPSILKSGKHDKAFYAQLWETITRGEVWRGGITNKRKDGSLYQEDATISPVRDNRGNVIAFVALKRDITKQLSLEAQLRQAQKMEAIGGLAAGIAHDFNNILSAVLGYTQLAMMDAEGETAIIGHLERVEKASLRARDLVHSILTFSRQTETVLRPVRLDVLIAEVLQLLRASLPRTIEFRDNVEPLEAHVQADPSQIHQVIMNLCTNAAHAMGEDGGILEVALSSVEIDGDTSKGPLELEEGRWARLSVSDTGHGMDAATIERIFEPFFTTKQDDGGTGLGLSMVHGIVKQHGGTITVYSEPGQGTVFHVYLPLTREAGADISESPAVVSRGSGEHVLVIDDEEPLAMLATEMLERLGYTVTAHTSPLEALEAFRAQPQKFDLVLTDQTMPQMTGQMLTKELKYIRPDIAVLVTTGYGGRIDKKAQGIAGVLLKPVLFDKLAIAIRAALRDSKS